MLRIPRDRKSRIQLALVVLFVGAFAFTVKAIADYLDWTASAVDLRDAISRGDLEAVKQFEVEGVDWRDLDDLPNNYSPLHQAASRGHLNLVRYFIENGADPTTELNSGHTPASLAFLHYRLGIAKYLLIERPEGESIAMNDSGIGRVAQFGDLDLVAWVSARSDLNGSVGPGDAYRLLCQAVREENLHMTEYLLDIGAPAAMANESWDEGFHRAPQTNGADAVPWLALYDSPKHFPLLHHAAKLGNDAIVKRLLEHGANPKTNDPHRKTPIDYAEENGHDAIVDLLQAALGED